MKLQVEPQTEPQSKGNLEETRVNDPDRVITAIDQSIHPSKRIEGDNIIIHNHPCRQLDFSLNTISLEMPWSRCSSA